MRLITLPCVVFLALSLICFDFDCQSPALLPLLWVKLVCGICQWILSTRVFDAKNAGLCNVLNFMRGHCVRRAAGIRLVIGYRWGICYTHPVCLAPLHAWPDLMTHFPLALLVKFLPVWQSSSLIGKAGRRWGCRYYTLAWTATSANLLQYAHTQLL